MAAACSASLLTKRSRHCDSKISPPPRAPLPVVAPLSLPIYMSFFLVNAHAVSFPRDASRPSAPQLRPPSPAPVAVRRPPSAAAAKRVREAMKVIMSAAARRHDSGH